MKRFTVVISRISVQAIAGVDLDASIELAVANERRRLEAYLYSSSTLVAFVSEVQPTTADRKTITCRALITVSEDGGDARFLDDYQAGRLQSGGFGTIHYVQDEQAAREHVGVDASEFDAADITPAEALEYAASCLESEVVVGSLGLDSDYEFGFSSIIVDGVERPYTEADQARDIAKHDAIVKLLRDLASNANYGQ